jgi:23S rRNA (pseudouridine1915-N3)-methyltransferase
MKIRILAVGHLKEAYWKAAEEEYLKRLSPYATVTVEEFDDLPTPAAPSATYGEAIKAKEDAKILSKLKSTDFVVLLDLGQDEPDSLSLAQKLADWERQSGAHLTFVIGGSLGLAQALKKRGNAALTLSRLTFTHQMARVILLEQLYRSYKILHHEPYHK